MTSRERVENALNHKQPDRTPMFEYVMLSPMAENFINRPAAYDPANWEMFYKEKGFEGAVRQAAVDLLDICDIIGHDMIYQIVNPPSTAPSASTNFAFEELSDDPVSVIRERNKKKADAAPIAPDECFLIYEFLIEEMKKRGVDLPIMLPGCTHGIWTDINLMLTMALDAEVAHEHFALCTRSAIALTEKAATYGINQIMVGGDFAGNRLLISPEAYREFIVPEVRKVSRRIHELGGWSMNASDGNLWEVIDDFLIGCEVDGYVEIDDQAGMDFAKLKKDYGDKICLYGNLDCGNVLSFATPEEVAAKTKYCLEAGLGNGGHIFSANNAITGSVPLENYLTAINTYKDFFDLPRLKL